MKKNNSLSNRQNEILTFIKKYIVKNGYSPSIREIATGVNLNSPATVHVHIQNLIEKGYLKRSNNNHKVLELTVPNEYELHENSSIAIPYIDKTNNKNVNDLLSNPDNYFYLSAQMIPNGTDIFVLKVQDDSMCNIGIYENDNIIVEKTKNIENGDIAIALIEETELTIRTFYRDEHYIRLQPENDLLPPTVLTEVNIIGKAIGLYRKI